MAGTERSRELGRWAEDEAARLLGGLGWKLLERNRRLGRGELDIIAYDGPVLVFVEVKASGTSRAPEQAVDRRKQSRLISAAQAYLAALDAPQPFCRFDVLSLWRENSRWRHRHIRDAFRAGE